MATEYPDRFTVEVAAAPDEVTACLKIRKQVFVGEQEIPEDLDSDGLDDSAVHVLARVASGRHRESPAATGRLVVGPAGRGVLARIAVLPEYRGCGLGRRVVACLEAAAVGLGVRELTLHPHSYLERFYERLGYRTVGGTSVAGKHELITMQKRFGQRPVSPPSR